jgi:transposase
MRAERSGWVWLCFGSLGGKAGEAGARLSKEQGMSVCAATLLSLLRQAVEADLPAPRVLGVDDWWFGTAHPTGTILVDLERHRPVDVLLGSDDQVLAEWLLTHPGVEIICRDRGASSPRGAKKGAPHARQVLDRWHLAQKRRRSPEAHSRPTRG